MFLEENLVLHEGKIESSIYLSRVVSGKKFFLIVTGMRKDLGSKNWNREFSES